MAIRYIEGRISIDNLNIKTERELHLFIRDIENAIRTVHPDIFFEGDVEITIDTKAGNFEGGR